MKYGIRVKDVMSRKPISVMARNNLCEVSKVLNKTKRGAVTVLGNSGKLIGIITATDIVTKGISKGCNPKTTKVKDIMSRRLLTFSEDDDLSKVAEKMNKRGVRRAPVVNDEKKVIGYISERDLLAIQPKLLDVLMEKLKIREPSLKLRYRVV